MADCSHKLVKDAFYVLHFNAPNKEKEDSILSQHLAFLFIVLSAILGVYCG